VGIGNVSKRRGVTDFLSIFQDDRSIFFDAETDILIVLNDAGAIERVNPAFERLLNRPEASVLNLLLTHFMRIDNQATDPIRFLKWGGGEIGVQLIAYRFARTEQGKRWYLILRPMA
jgi:PAS domain-containing protein